MSTLNAARIALGTTMLVSLILCCSLSAEAATVGYWRFENSPGYLNDSSVNGHTLVTAGSAPTQTGIPGAGNGSEFPATIPNTGATNGNFADTNGGSGHFSPGDIFAPIDLTIEAFINKENQSSGTQYIVGQWNTSVNQRGFGFGVGGSTHATVGVNELFFVSSDDGSSTDLVLSGMFLNLNTDYYTAVSFDESNMASGVTFYLQDLTNGGPLLSTMIGHGIVNDIHDSTDLLRIGALTSSGNRLNGLIDEVRISDIVLDSSQLLITALPAAPVPEPSAFGLVLLGGVAMLCKRRRRV